MNLDGSGKVSQRGEEPSSAGDGSSGFSEDERLALEIAEFVAERVEVFDDPEFRSWAITDFEVWAVLAGRSPRLSLVHERSSDAAGGNAP